MTPDSLIPNQWYPIFDSLKLTRRKPVGITRLGERLALWRDDSGLAVAAPDRCPHRAAQLSRGRIRDGCLECPYHGLRFDGCGRCVLIPANGEGAPIPRGFDLPTRRIREAHGLIWYWYGDSEASAEIPWFPEAPENGSCTTTVGAEYPISYLRVMENFGDAHHLPFVHRWSFPNVGTRFELLRAEDNGAAITIDAMMRPERRDRFKFAVPFKSSMRLPTLAMIEITPKMRFVATATPVDQSHTWLWARYEQTYLPRWLGGRVIARLAAAMDMRIIFSAQDFPTLRSQQLEDPADISQYHLFEADRAIAYYFAMRKRALSAARNRDDASTSRVAAR